MIWGSDLLTWKAGPVDRMATGAVALRADFPALNHHLQRKELEVGSKERE